jgi:glycosyltransferase involved in cell wall biosynthesis
MNICIVVPTYKRVQRIKETAEQLKKYKNVIFVCHEDDQPSIEAVRGLENVHLVIDTQEPSGVNATNAGYQAAWTDLVAIGQDDFTWHEGWLEKALEKYNEGYKVVGFNDCFPGHADQGHAVGWLVERDYVNNVGLTADTKGVIFYPGYKKNCSDGELNEYNHVKGVFAIASDSRVEHLHHTMGKSQDDETYSRLEAFKSEDEVLFNERKQLYWAT